MEEEAGEAGPTTAGEAPTEPAPQATPQTASPQASTPAQMHAAHADERAKIPAPPQFRVKNGGRVMHGGFMTDLKPGKILDERHYNLKLLRDQGIILEAL